MPKEDPDLDLILELSIKQGWKKPGFFFKPSSVVFFGFFWVFWVFWVFWFFIGFFCPDERVFRVFSVSQILLGASRL